MISLIVMRAESESSGLKRGHFRSDFTSRFTKEMFSVQPPIYAQVRLKNCLSHVVALRRLVAFHRFSYSDVRPKSRRI